MVNGCEKSAEQLPTFDNDFEIFMHSWFDEWAGRRWSYLQLRSLRSTPLQTVHVPINPSYGGKEWTKDAALGPAETLDVGGPLESKQSVTITRAGYQPLMLEVQSGSDGQVQLVKRPIAVLADQIRQDDQHRSLLRTITIGGIGLIVAGFVLWDYLARRRRRARERAVAATAPGVRGN
jgi:hypothetical protein